MPKAKKLPSGNYRCRVFSHTDSEGKKIYKSFTAPTKKQAELKATEWANGRKGLYDNKLTVLDALNGYIKAKENVLSPSTIREYVRMTKQHFEKLGIERIERLTNEKLQLFVSDLCTRVSPKTVRNVYGLLVSAIKFYFPQANYVVTLPKGTKKIVTSPEDADIKRLFEEAKPWLKICIALAAFGSLRRGEICGLTYKDIKGKAVYVHTDVVKDRNQKWVHKDMPKTSDSIRTVMLPEEVISLLGSGSPDARIIACCPDNITKQFIALRKKLNIDIRFHDLRHYFVSIGAVLHIPQNYLKDFGGWNQNSKVMETVYQNKIVSMSDHYSNVMVEHFRKIIE